MEHSRRTGNKSSLLFSSVAAGCRVSCSIHCKNQTSHSEAEANFSSVTMGSLCICVPYICWQWFSMLLPGPLCSIPAPISLCHRFGGVSVQAPSHHLCWALKLLKQPLWAVFDGTVVSHLAFPNLKKCFPKVVFYSCYWEIRQPSDTDSTGMRSATAPLQGKQMNLEHILKSIDKDDVSCALNCK